MKRLLVDAGNTAVKWRALGDGAETQRDGRALREPLDTLAPRLAAGWPALTGGIAMGTCVADTATRAAIEQAALERGARAVHWLGAQSQFVATGGAADPGARVLANGYADPLQLGADRWHALVGAFVRHPRRSLVVASSGTALTVDCLRAQPGGHGRFIGGVIVPGAMLMRGALARGTAQLPLTRGHARAVPDNTMDAIASGIEAALAGSVERIARGFSRALAADGAAPPLLLIGGGGAEALAAALQDGVAGAAAPGVAGVQIEADLVLAGIACRIGEHGAPWAGEAGR